MNKTQWVSISVSFVLILVLFFAFDTTPKSQKELEKSRILVAESTDINVLVTEAKEELGEARSSGVMSLENAIRETEDKSTQIELYKQLSGTWYELEKHAIAGYYAQQVASLDEQEESWSIAGTTYTIALQRSTIKKERDFAAKRAVEAFENAISLNPENPANHVNLALVYTERPPEGNPMKGIQMLLKLNNDDPDNVVVLTTLGRLAIRTGQFERAVERLGKALELEPQNKNATCLLAQAYQGKGELDKAATLQQRCENF